MSNPLSRHVDAIHMSCLPVRSIPIQLDPETTHALYYLVLILSFKRIAISR